MLILTLLDPQRRTPVKQWRFEQESRIQIGRAPDNHVVLSNLLVSRHHLELQKVGGSEGISSAQPQWLLINHSTNGTFLNGCLVNREPLPEDAQVELARGGPCLRIHVQSCVPAHPISAPDKPSPQLPKLPTPPAACTHVGNAPGNLFCIRCGRPIAVEKTIRQYQVLRVLGRGGMGTTYLVWAPQPAGFPTSPPQGNLLALKEMNADMVRISKAQELFEREANTLKSLNHPGIPKFYDFFVEAGKKYLVMELLHGQDLEKWVQQHGPVPLRQAIAWMIDTCEVLEYLHNRPVPIIHRDIKPGNLLVQTLTNRIVVLDFGAVRAAGLPSGTRIGAEGYSAPEQNQGRPVPQSDLYAIGPSLFYLLTGKNPHAFYKKLDGRYRFVPTDPALTPRLQRVLQRVTEPRISDRYPTARQLAQALAQCLSQ